LHLVFHISQLRRWIRTPLDAKLWAILYVVGQIAEKGGITLPPSVLIGPPPDPMAMQAAQQELGQQQGGPSAATAPPDPSMGGGAPAAAPPDQSAIAPIDPMQGAAPKAAGILGSVYADDTSIAAPKVAQSPVSWASAARERARNMAGLSSPLG
jgi:hypothetical protein